MVIKRERWFDRVYVLGEADVRSERGEYETRIEECVRLMLGDGFYDGIRDGEIDG